MLTDEVLFPHALVWVGHKGKFVERLDAGVVNSGLAENPRLVAGADLLVHYNNRTLRPPLGRFLQQDPNATAMALLGSLAHSGSGLGSGVDALDLDLLTGDGANLYQYVGSSPWVHGDPLGLFVMGAVDVYGEIAFTAGYLAARLTSEYAANLEHDSQWATDWSQADDWHTRSDATWIEDIYAEVNVNGAVNGYANPFSGWFDQAGFAQGNSWLRPIRIAGKLVRLGRKHHALPKYLARIIGKESKVLAKLPDRMHKKYHHHLDHALRGKPLYAPRMRAPRGEWDAWAARYPDRVAQLPRLIRAKTAEFSKTHGIQGLVEALDEALR